jgi:beta-phosphoglucomutase-like phosphatase (HAD superfamily)
VSFGTAQPPEWDGAGPSAVAIAFEGAILGDRTIFTAFARGTLAGYGRRAGADPLAGVRSPSLSELARKLSRDLDAPALAEQIEHRLERQLQAQLACDAHLLPGAITLLRRLSAALPLALTSSLPEDLIAPTLDAAGIADFFAATVGEGALRAGPPSRAVHLEAARRLGVPIPQVLAIEATEAGAIAARSAGMPVIGAALATASAPKGPLDFDQLMRHSSPSRLGGCNHLQPVGPMGGPKRGSI